MPSKEYSRRGTKNESFKNGDYNKKTAHEPAPVTDFKDFDVDQFLFDHRVSIVVKVAISVLLYAAAIAIFILIFRYNGYSFGGFVFGAVVGYVAFVICLEIDGSIYKNLIKKSVESIKEITAFGYEPKRFIYGKYLSLKDGGDFSLSTQDATTIKIGDIRTLEYEFDISQKDINDKLHNVFNGEYVNCLNNQERANEIMVVCGAFPANIKQISIPVNKDEKDPKYKIFALSTENLDDSDIGYVRHVADTVYDILKAKPHMVYFKKGGVEVIYEIPDLLKYDHSMLFFGEMRKDFEALGERLNFAKRLSADDYVEQENGRDDVIPLPVQEEPEPSIEPEPEQVPLAELNTVVEDEKPVVEEKTDDQRREPFPRKRPLATYKDIKTEVIKKLNTSKFVQQNQWKISLIFVMKILSWGAALGLFAWIIAKMIRPNILVIIGFASFYFPIIYLVIKLIFGGRFISMRDKMFQQLDNLKWLDYNSIPILWESALEFNTREHIKVWGEDECKITFGSSVINHAEFKLYYEIRTGKNETKDVDLFTGVYMKVKPDEPFAENIMIVRGDMPYKHMPVRYKDNIYAMSQNDIEISDIERAENIAENLSSYMQHNFILLFRDGEVRLYIKCPIKTFDYIGTESMDSMIRRDAAAVAHRMQIAHILAEQ